MGIMSGNPKDEPMHYGEVMGAWSFLMAAHGINAGYQVLLNHTGDKDLQDLVEEAITKSKQEIEQIEGLLKENGVGLPPAPPNRPKVALDEIPAGARFLDQEIAATISIDNALGLIECSKIIGQCIREDVAAMFAQFHTQKLALGTKLLRLNKEKGWLVPPPLHQIKSEEK